MIHDNDTMIHDSVWYDSGHKNDMNDRMKTHMSHFMTVATDKCVRHGIGQCI